MQPTPAQPRGPEIVPNPSSAATPTNPNPRPRMPHSPKRSCTPKNRWISAIDSGTMAMRIPVTEELIQRSPYEITEKGITNSANANAQIAALCLPRERKAPRRHAIGSKINVPKPTRPKATTTGDSSCTDNLIKKYGRPQMMPSAAKAPHARHLTDSTCLSRIAVNVVQTMLSGICLRSALTSLPAGEAFACSAGFENESSKRCHGRNTSSFAFAEQALASEHPLTTHLRF